MAIFEVNNVYYIERETIENKGYEFQIREFEKFNDYEAKATIYIWAPEGREFVEVPEEFYNDPIVWESSIFSGTNEVIFETHNAYLMHDGACCCLIGGVGRA